MTQARLLALLFDPGSTEMSVTELAEHIGGPLATVAREVARLERHGTIVSRLVGRSKLVSANWELPFARPLAALLAYTAGLPWILGQALREVDAEQAYLFGSWAARYMGESGPPPNDIDLLVIGKDLEFGALRAAVRPVERDLRIEINPVTVTPARWASRGDADDPFLATVASRPMVPVPVERVAA